MTRDQTPARNEPLRFDCTLDAPPEKVWRALTVPELVAAWLAPNDLTTEPGARFTLTNGSADKRDVACEIIAADPCRTLSYRWRTETPDGRAVDSTVTFTLTDMKDEGTRLRIVHDDFATVEAEAAAPVLRVVARNDYPAAASSRRARNASLKRRTRAPHMLMAA